jgi:hypothetical protein
MKIQIDVRWPQFLRSRPRWAKLAVAALVAAGVFAVPVAWASHNFTDVPNGHPFHTDISAVLGAGITAGKTCVPPGTPPTYCPSEPITREAMAAFMRRGGGRMAQDQTADVAANLTGATILEVEEEDMTVGGVNGTQLVMVQGSVTIDSAAVGCPCEWRAFLVQDDGTASEVVSDPTYLEVEAGDGDIDATVHISWSFIAGSGPHNYSLQLQNWNTVNTFDLTGASIRVITAPFDQDGLTGILSADDQGSSDPRDIPTEAQS